LPDSAIIFQGVIEAAKRFFENSIKYLELFTTYLNLFASLP